MLKLDLFFRRFRKEGKTVGEGCILLSIIRSSSSGCGVLVATGDTDMAIGGDQGGSIRIVSVVSDRDPDRYLRLNKSTW